VVEIVRAMLLDLVRRRLSRTVVRPEAIKSELIYVTVSGRGFKEDVKPLPSPHIALDRFAKKRS